MNLHRSSVEFSLNVIEPLHIGSGLARTEQIDRQDLLGIY